MNRALHDIKQLRTTLERHLTGIAGVVGAEKSDVVSKVKMILGAMDARGSVIQSTSIKHGNLAIAVGSCSHPSEESANNPIDKTSFVADGSIPSDLRLEEIGGQPGQYSISEAIRSGGPLSCLAISTGRLLVARDILGQKPLYYAKDRRQVVAFASLKKALSEIGLRHSEPATPGLLAAVSRTRLSTVSDLTLSRPKIVRVSEQKASERLGELLIKSLEEDLPSHSALAFSGGLDSTLVAQAAKENDLYPELITVSMKGQKEVEHAWQVSKRLGLDITTRELSAQEVLAVLPDVVETVESTDPVIVGVSVPLYFACEMAQEMGVECLLAGQLSDELFAGYGRFERLALNNKARLVENEVWNSVKAASTNDFEPGDKLAVSHNLELRCPFAFLPLVKYALRLPTSLKLRASARKVVRKYILRRLAADWKLPNSVVDRPKKAVQYSSGVQKVLLKEAKKKKMALRDFLRSLR